MLVGFSWLSDRGWELPASAVGSDFNNLSSLIISVGGTQETHTH